MSERTDLLLTWPFPQPDVSASGDPHRFGRSSVGPNDPVASFGLPGAQPH